jgi:hypothetical protein
MSERFSIQQPEKLGRPGAVVVVRTRRARAGVHVKFENGWTVSVQWGAGNYGSNYDLSFDAETVPDATTAEIAAWKNDRDLMEWADGDTVQGWCSWERVQRVLDLAADDALAREFVPSATPLVRLDDGWEDGAA